MTIIKKNCRQNNICHNVAPSNDLTKIPPKLKVHAPKNTKIGPGTFDIIFIKFAKLYFLFLVNIIEIIFQLL